MKPISKWICDDGDEEKMWLLLDIKINIRGSQASLRLKTVVCPNEYYHLTTSHSVRGAGPPNVYKQEWIAASKSIRPKQIYSDMGRRGFVLR